MHSPSVLAAATWQLHMWQERNIRVFQDQDPRKVWLL